MTADHTDPFTRLLQSARKAHRPIILDGATGTELDNRGADTSSPLWSGLAPLEEQPLLEEVHRDYLACGAQLLTSCTFRTTQRAFDKGNHPAGHWLKALQSAVRIARMIAAGSCLVAGSVGPLEDCFQPHLSPTGATARREHEQSCAALVAAGVDLLWLETFGTLDEIAAAIAAAKAAIDERPISFIVSVVTGSDGRLISGEPLVDAQRLAHEGGAAAFGLNCIPTGHVETALQCLVQIDDLPLSVYANLGFADPHQDWQGSASLSPVAYAELAASWIDRGVTLVGGCCGSTPAHIRALARRLNPGDHPAEPDRSS